MIRLKKWFQILSTNSFKLAFSVFCLVRMNSITKKVFDERSVTLQNQKSKALLLLLNL